jgi:5-methylcytosine-specific restriction endonuclease McrA
MVKLDLEHAKRIRENNKRIDEKREKRRKKLKAIRAPKIVEKPATFVKKPNPKHIAWRDNPPKYVKGMKSEFYWTREWRSLRWEVLSKSDGKCVMCGDCKENGAIMHIDHIMPRSKFPSKELDITNLQVLCEACNMGKGNKY